MTIDHGPRKSLRKEFFKVLEKKNGMDMISMPHFLAPFEEIDKADKEYGTNLLSSILSTSHRIPLYEFAQSYKRCVQGSKDRHQFFVDFIAEFSKGNNFLPKDGISLIEENLNNSPHFLALSLGDNELRDNDDPILKPKRSIDFSRLEGII